MLCKRRKLLGEEEFDVEVALMQGKMLLSAASVASPETIVVEIPSDKSTRLFGIVSSRETT